MPDSWPSSHPPTVSIPTKGSMLAGSPEIPGPDLSNLPEGRPEGGQTRGPDGGLEVPRPGQPTTVADPHPPTKDWIPVQFRGRRVFELGAAAYFVFMTILTVVDGVGPGFIRWLLPLVLGINSIHFLRRALDPRPRLALEEGGIRDRTSIGSVELFIPWEEVEGVQVNPGRGTVEVRVRDPISLRRTPGWIRRLWMEIGGLTGKKTISINPGFLGLKKPELTDLIEEALFAYERSRLGFVLGGAGALSPGVGPDAGKEKPNEDLT